LPSLWREEPDQRSARTIIKKVGAASREYKYAKNAPEKNVAKSDSVEADTHANFMMKSMDTDK